MLPDAVRKLHQLARATASDATSWPATYEATRQIWQVLMSAGLVQKADDGILRYSSAGSAAFIELLLAYIGAIHVWDIHFVLESHGNRNASEFGKLKLTPMLCAC